MSDTNGGLPTADDVRGILPMTREAIVEQGNRIHQEVAHERDMLRLELADTKTELAASRVVAEAYKAQAEQAADAFQAQLALADSRVAQSRIEWEAMHDKLAVYRVLFQSFGALWRAFEIEHAPLIRSSTEQQMEQLREQSRSLSEKMGTYAPMEGGL